MKNACKFALMSFFLIVSNTYAVHDFDQKFERQKQPNYKGGPVWKPGEQVRAAFTPSTCDGFLSLQVAEGVKGGVGDIRHADLFQLVDINPDDLQKLEDWKGMSFIGTVEVLNAIDQGYVISNMFNYQARIVNLQSPTSPLNPSSDEIAKLEPGTEIILLGKVTEAEYSNEPNGRRHLALQTPNKQKYVITLWSGIPILDSDLSNTIQNLNGNERLEVGDDVQLKVYKAKEEGGLATHWCRSCNLDYPSPEREKRYRTEREYVNSLFEQLQKHIKTTNWSEMRRVHALFAKIQKTKIELVQHEHLMKTVPEKERPLPMVESRYVLDALNSMFAKDFDAMTVEEFIKFCHSWAKMETKTIPKSAETKGGRDQSYLFRLLEKIPGIDGKNLTATIALLGAENRLAYFKARSDKGMIHNHDLDWDEEYNLEQALIYSATPPNANRVSSLISITKKIANLEKQGWGYNNKFVYKAVQTLELAFEVALESETAEPKDALAEFVLQKGELVAIYNTLQGIRRESRPPKMIFIGMPTPAEPTKEQQASQFSIPLQMLEGIIKKL